MVSSANEGGLGNSGEGEENKRWPPDQRGRVCAERTLFAAADYSNTLPIYSAAPLLINQPLKGSASSCNQQHTCSAQTEQSQSTKEYSTCRKSSASNRQHTRWFCKDRTFSKDENKHLQEVVCRHAQHLGAQLLHGRCRTLRGQPPVLLPAQAAVGNGRGTVCCSSHCDASCP